MDDQPEKHRDWSSLPADLLLLVLQRLNNTNTDRRRLRAVCTSWRSSVSPLRPQQLKFPLEVLGLPLPEPKLHSTERSEPVQVQGFLEILRQSIYYLISLPKEGSSAHVWLTRVEEVSRLSPLNIWKLQNPMSPVLDYILLPILKAEVNFLDYRISEVARSYHFPRGNCFFLGTVATVKTVILPSPNSEPTDGNFSLFTLTCKQNLFLLKSGAENWVRITEVCHPVGDIISYEGKFYATDLKGKLIAIDPKTFEVKELIKSRLQEPNRDGLYCYLVESCGRLYLVQKVIYMSGFICEKKGTPLELKAFVLSYSCSSNGDISHYWEPVTSLGDQVFFVSNYVTFSMSAQELAWDQGNCIIFTQEDMSRFEFSSYDSFDYETEYPSGRISRHCGIYILEDGRIITSYVWPSMLTKLFWPVPSWLAATSITQF